MNKYLPTLTKIGGALGVKTKRLYKRWMGNPARDEGVLTTTASITYTGQPLWPENFAPGIPFSERFRCALSQSGFRAGSFCLGSSQCQSRTPLHRRAVPLKTGSIPRTLCWSARLSFPWRMVSLKQQKSPVRGNVLSAKRKAPTHEYQRAGARLSRVSPDTQAQRYSKARKLTRQCVALSWVCLS